MKIPKKITAGIFILIICGFIVMFVRNNSVSENKNLISDNQGPLFSDTGDILKTGVDLTTADYNQFYEELSPYGQWLKIKPGDIGLKQKSNTGDKKSSNSSIINNILGIRDAYAESYVGWDFFFVWQPSPGLSVGVIAGESGPAFVPYTNGRWIYTESGWYFKAPTHYEEIVHHYGRWCYNGAYGWIWIPGRVWAPSWVRWAEDDNYIGWAPVETSVYIYNQYYVIPQPVYTFVSVEKKYFLEPEPYRFLRINKFDNDRYDFRNFKIHEGPAYKNNVLVNEGPDKRKIEKVYGKNILPVNIKKLGDDGKIKFWKGKHDVSDQVYKSKPDKKNFKDRRSNPDLKKDANKTRDKNKAKDYTNKKNRDKSFENRVKADRKEKSYGIKKFMNPDKNTKNKSGKIKEFNPNKKNKNDEIRKTESFPNKNVSTERERGKKKK